MCGGVTLASWMDRAGIRVHREAFNRNGCGGSAEEASLMQMPVQKAFTHTRLYIATAKEVQLFSCASALDPI